MVGRPKISAAIVTTVGSSGRLGSCRCGPRATFRQPLTVTLAGSFSVNENVAPTGGDGLRSPPSAFHRDNAGSRA